MIGEPKFSDWFAHIHEEQARFWASPDGIAKRARLDAEQAELDAWLAANPSVTVSEHGGLAPEQWMGSVDGHTFYFRERHGTWRVELHLQPYQRGDGTISSALVGEVIAEGFESAPGYGNAPLERLWFIVDIIRVHLGQQGHPDHIAGVVDELRTLLGKDLRWCPRCGARIR